MRRQLWLVLSSCWLILYGCSPGEPESGGFALPPLPQKEIGAAARNLLEDARAAAVATPDDPDVLAAYAMRLQAYGISRKQTPSISIYATPTPIPAGRVSMV